MCRSSCFGILATFAALFGFAVFGFVSVRSVSMMPPAPVESAQFMMPTPTAITPCFFNWATQDLPDLNASLAESVTAAGLENVLITASAYGENCIDSVTNEVQSFGAMQTDFYVQVSMDDLSDDEALGNLLADVLAMIVAAPPEMMMGPNPGMVSVLFNLSGTPESPDTYVQRTANFSVSQAEDAVAGGLRGAALLRELGVEPLPTPGLAPTITPTP